MYVICILLVNFYNRNFMDIVKQNMWPCILLDLTLFVLDFRLKKILALSVSLHLQKNTQQIFFDFSLVLPELELYRNGHFSFLPVKTGLKAISKILYPLSIKIFKYEYDRSSKTFLSKKAAINYIVSKY